MTFNYCKKKDDDVLNYEVSVDEEQLAELYMSFFEKYSNRREIVFYSDKKIVLYDNEEYLLVRAY